MCACVIVCMCVCVCWGWNIAKKNIDSMAGRMRHSVRQQSRRAAQYNTPFVDPKSLTLGIEPESHLMRT